jgi:hypothetical protein
MFTPVHLSCGQCKCIRPFSGTPPICEVCGWVCGTSKPVDIASSQNLNTPESFDTSYWQNLRAQRQQPVTIETSDYGKTENQNKESGESLDRSASRPEIQALLDRIAKLGAQKPGIDTGLDEEKKKRSQEWLFEQH